MVDMKDFYYIDMVYYICFNLCMLRIMERGCRGLLLIFGEQFNVSDLDVECSCISILLCNCGYFYFCLDYMKYQVDILLNFGYVSFWLIFVLGFLDVVQCLYYVGKILVFLYGKGGEVLNSIFEYWGFDIYYYKKMQVCLNMFYCWLNYQVYVCNDFLCNFVYSCLYSQYW